MIFHHYCAKEPNRSESVPARIYSPPRLRRGAYVHRVPLVGWMINCVVPHMQITVCESASSLCIAEIPGQTRRCRLA